LISIKVALLARCDGFRMNTELLAKYDRPVPRYTSYPTAPHFHAGIGPAAHREWLAEPLAGELEALAPFEVDGRVTIENRMIRIEPQGRPLVRAVCAVFNAYLDRGVAPHSRAVRDARRAHAGT
jgi:coproporphyrinogen III oxidase-like Fe-S oxidoreductase